MFIPDLLIRMLYLCASAQVIIDCTASSYVPQFYRRWMEQVRLAGLGSCYGGLLG